MAHLFAVIPKHPNAAQKSRLVKQIKAVDSDLSLVVYADPDGSKRMWIEAPDNYGAEASADK